MKSAVLALGLLICFHQSLLSCTIVSGIDHKGQTWVMNNEDFFHTYSNYVNIFPATKEALGYITMTYGSAESGIQGGANEAGVFFDINALPPQENTLSRGRKPFQGSMLLYFLQHCHSVPEFLTLWDTYCMPGMTDIQIHLADRQGNLAIITPDSILRSTKKLTSTNFNVCETDPAKKLCWRYPVAEKLLADGGITKDNLVRIASATSWREFTTTVYTDIHNLSTGDIWYYLAEDYQRSWKTNIHSLIKSGRKSILLSSEFPENDGLKMNRFIGNGADAKRIGELFSSGKFDETKQESMLRLSFLNYFYMEKDFKKAAVVFPQWETVMQVNTKLDSTELKFIKAQYLAVIGKNEQAIQCLQTLQMQHWRSDALLSSLSDSGRHNVTIKLPGFDDAKAVVLEIKGEYNLFRVLRKSNKGWHINIQSDKNEIKYCFYVDGKRIVDKTSPVIKKQETVKGDFKDFNLLILPSAS